MSFQRHLPEGHTPARQRRLPDPTVVSPEDKTRDRVASS